MWAGLAKWFVWSGALPEMSAWMINLTKLLSIVEPLGAVALILGLLTRWAASGLAIIMLGSLYFVYFMFDAGIFTSEKGAGMDYNLLLLAGNLLLAAFGAGRWSVDARDSPLPNSDAPENRPCGIKTEQKRYSSAASAAVLRRKTVTDRAAGV